MSATAIAFSDNSSKRTSVNWCEKRYGEVFVIQQQVVLRCSLCGERYRIYKKFLEHIITHCREDEKQQTTRTRRRLPDAHGHAPHDSSDNGDCVAAKDALEEVYIETERTAALDAQYTAEIAPAERNAISDENCVEMASDDSTRDPSPLLLAPKRRNNRKETERKYKCETCGAAFTDWSNMRAHSKRHTGDKPYACDQCEKRFYSNTELVSHVRRHTGERPYVCAYCGRGFPTSSAMRNHERRHTNDRPHKCEFCDKCFHDVKRLKDHLVVHTRERNYVCNTCNGRFSRRKTLLVHMKLHVNAREYACDLCDMAFNQLPGLLLHRKNKHKVLGNHKIGRASESAQTGEVESCRLDFADKATVLEHLQVKQADEDEMVLKEVISEHIQYN